MNLLADKRVLAVVAAVGLLASLLVWVLSRGDDLGEMRVRAEGGTVEVERDGEIIRVGDQTPIEAGDVVTTAEDSYALVRLEKDRRISLGPEARIEVLGGTGLQSHVGTLVARAGDPLRIAMGDTIARGDGSRFRIDRDLGTTRAAAFEGELELSAPGSPNLKLGKLWQTTITADELFGKEPYELDEDDHFDRTFLDSLVELDQAITELKRGFAPLVAGSAPDLAFFSALADREVDFMRKQMGRVSAKRPGYTTDLMIALKLADAAKGSMENAFERGLDYYRQGASWGVVGGMLGVDRDEEWKGPLRELQVAMTGSSGVAGGASEDPDLTLAGGEELGATDGSIDGSAPSDGGGEDPGGGEVPPAGDPGDPGDPGDDPGDDPTDSPPSPPPCDVQCEVEKVIPTPDPNDALDPPPVGKQ